MVPFLGHQALNKRSNPNTNVVVYFHTEQTAKTAKTLKRLGTRLQSLQRGVGTGGFCFRYNTPSRFRTLSQCYGTRAHKQSDERNMH